MNNWKFLAGLLFSIVIVSVPSSAAPKQPERIVELHDVYDLGYGSNISGKPSEYDLLDARGFRGNGCKVLVLPMQKTLYAFLQFCTAPGEVDKASFDRGFVYQKGDKQSIIPQRAELKLTPKPQLNFEFMFKGTLYAWRESTMTAADLLKLKTWPGLTEIKIGGMDD